MDINADVIKAEFEGLDPTVIEALIKPEALSKLTAFSDKIRQPLLANVNEINGKFTSLDAELKALGGLDALKAQVTESKKKKADKVPTDELEQYKQQAQAELEQHTSRAAKLESSLLNKEVAYQVSKAGVSPLLEPHVRSRLKATLSEEGETEITVLNTDGSPMLTSGMKPATIADLLTELKKNPDFAPAFVEHKSGSGAKSSDTHGVVNPFLAATRNYGEQQKIAKSNPALAKALAAAAGINLNL